ncbi:MAG: ATP-binding cassette domain-containing protein [Synergistaceae bacterium]|jgi:lincosamide and streptogramin A transport system ATP-binding/permease protein|nr:ATP-binding cassette domain-containing protein [Synergistaceae bacterium]
MSLVTISNLTFSYDAHGGNIFESVSFQFDTDWRLGLIGRNGCGKTTFLKLLTGEYGKIGGISAPVSFSYFPFAVSRPERDTIDIVDEVNHEYAFWELCKELNMMRAAEEILFRPFGTLSGGEQTKVLMASLFLRSNNFLLLDEPTNHLDLDGKRSVAEYLRSKKGFILVSHDRNLLDHTVDHIMSIDGSDIEIRRGGFSQWLENEEKRETWEKRRNCKLKREIEKLEIASDRAANWSNKTESSKFGAGPVDRGFVGHKAAKMMKRAKSLERRRNDAIEQKSLLLRNLDETESLKLLPVQWHSEVLAELSDVAIAYDGADAVLRGVNASIRRNDRLAVIGGNGCGKSSLLKLIAGEDIPYSGTIKLNPTLKISYVPQSASGLRGDIGSFTRDAAVDTTLFLTNLSKLGVERAQFEKDLNELSEGQKKKILLAKSLSEQAHLYLWDEPLNCIDIPSRMQIEELLLERRPTMVFAEHDETFARKIATVNLKLPPASD